MKILDRVKLIEPHKLYNGIIVPIGTIGTIRSINNHEIILQAGIDPQNFTVLKGAKNSSNLLPQLFAISDLIVVPINNDDLCNIDYRFITPKIFHPGNMWSVKVDYDRDNNPIYRSGIIDKYILALSEDDDKVILTFLEDIYNNFKDGQDIKSKEYLIRYLNNFGSYSVIIE